MVSRETYELTVIGPPPRKNARHEIVSFGRRAGMKNSDSFKNWSTALACSWSTNYAGEKLNQGAWCITVRSYWDRLRHLDEEFPFGDCDASVSWVMDALQEVDIVDDDMRFVREVGEKFYDKENPRTEIMIERVNDGD